MASLELPHTANCLVCGRDNPHGLKLSLFVDPGAGVVEVKFVPWPHHVGFEGMIHGGALATVFDEAMVWAATWRDKRFCVCGELSVRFRQSISVGRALSIRAEVEFSRPKLVQTVAKAFDPANTLVAFATGKYVPVSTPQHDEFVATLLDEPATKAAADLLKHG